jgi:hypothetical protein
MIRAGSFAGSKTYRFLRCGFAAALVPWGDPFRASVCRMSVFSFFS